MSFVSHISDPNIMNESDLFTLKENYAAGVRNITSNVLHTTADIISPEQ